MLEFIAHISPDKPIIPIIEKYGFHMRILCNAMDPIITLLIRKEIVFPETDFVIYNFSGNDIYTSPKVDFNVIEKTQWFKDRDGIVHKHVFTPISAVVKLLPLQAQKMGLAKELIETDYEISMLARQGLDELKQEIEFQLEKNVKMKFTQPSHAPQGFDENQQLEFFGRKFNYHGVVPLIEIESN